MSGQSFEEKNLREYALGHLDIIEVGLSLAQYNEARAAIEVGFGKIIEKFLPAYRDLDLQFTECRPLYDPIDVLVFSGLLNRKVDSITFLEIKSGNAKLNNHQKMIRDAVLDKNVDMRVLK
ncbi:MAG: Holliday junction resolvase-like protein [Candidatus Bathyarchaeia archaeon]|jgi:predicted Holliday junction resolvase-like endonuclease